jgi:hypothetical protein
LDTVIPYELEASAGVKFTEPFREQPGIEVSADMRKMSLDQLRDQVAAIEDPHARDEGLTVYSVAMESIRSARCSACARRGAEARLRVWLTKYRQTTKGGQDNGPV